MDLLSWVGEKKGVEKSKFYNEMLSLGRNHDSVHAVPLLSQINIEGSKNHLGIYSSTNATYTISPKESAVYPWSVDWHTYKECHLVECFF